MFIEMIDLLRCPRDHEETWLVAAFTKMEGRFVIEGKLGCPICSASYDIVDGVAQFGGEPDRAFAPAVTGDQVMRTAAILNLTTPGSLVILCESEAIASQEVAELAQCRVIALNPSGSIEDTDRVATVTCGDRIPLATASADAIAIGNAANLVHDAARMLRPGGRISAASGIDVSNDFIVRAKDAQHVVAELPGSLIPLQRRTI